MTTIIKHYQRIKATYPDAIVRFRIGDHYETFGEDAHTISQYLGIPLTLSTGNEIK